MLLRERKKKNVLFTFCSLQPFLSYFFRLLSFNFPSFLFFSLYLLLSLSLCLPLTLSHNSLPLSLPLSFLFSLSISRNAFTQKLFYGCLCLPKINNISVGSSLPFRLTLPQVLTALSSARELLAVISLQPSSFLRIKKSLSCLFSPLSDFLYFSLSLFHILSFSFI